MTIQRVTTPTRHLTNGHKFQRIAALRTEIDGRSVIASVYVNQIKYGPLYLSLRWHSALNPREYDTHTPDVLKKVQTLINESGGLSKWRP